MGYTTVRTHMRRGYQVRAHSRRTNDWRIADILQRDLDRVFERIDQQGATEQLSSANPACSHPSWYPVRRLLLDTPYEDSPILAYCCTGCAATKAAAGAKERVLAEGEAPHA